jgi:hypothetical protein
MVLERWRKSQQERGQATRHIGGHGVRRALVHLRGPGTDPASRVSGSGPSPLDPFEKVPQEWLDWCVQWRRLLQRTSTGLLGGRLHAAWDLRLRPTAYQVTEIPLPGRRMASESSIDFAWNVVE